MANWLYEKIGWISKDKNCKLCCECLWVSFRYDWWYDRL